MLFAERIEDPARPTAFIDGDGDVVAGYDEQWSDGRSPWAVSVANGRWYGRGTADNKGQHTVNLAALGRVIDARGRLGFNAKLLIEMGEEVGSPGLHAVCEQRAEALRADVLIASDGPRLASERPTIFSARAVLSISIFASVARRGASFRQLGRAARESRDDARQRHCRAGRGARPYPGRCPAASVDPRIDPSCAGRDRARRAGGPGDRRGLGGTGADAGGARVRLERPRSTRVSHRQSGAAGQCDPAARAREPSGPICRRLRLAHLHRLRAPRCAWIHGGGNCPGNDGTDGGNATRSRSSVGALGKRIDRHDHRRGTGDSAESRRVVAERLLCRDSRSADDLGTALLSGMLATRAERAHAGRVAREGAIRPGCSGIWVPRGRRHRPCSGYGRMYAQPRCCRDIGSTTPAGT